MLFCWWWIHHRLELGKNETSRRTRGGSVVMEWHSQHAAVPCLNECVSLTVMNGILGNGFFFLTVEQSGTHSHILPVNLWPLTTPSKSPFRSRSLGDVVIPLAGKEGCTKRDSGTWAAFFHPPSPSSICVSLFSAQVWAFRLWQDCAEGTCGTCLEPFHSLSTIAALMKLEMKT